MDDVRSPLPPRESVVLSGKARRSSRGNSWEFGHLFTHLFPHLPLYPIIHSSIHSSLGHETLGLGRSCVEDSDEVSAPVSSQSDGTVTTQHHRRSGDCFIVFCH